jgi:uncharacterized protein (TIGR00369 family)
MQNPELYQCILDENLTQLIAAIPYAQLIGIQGKKLDGSFKFTLPKNDSNLGNPILPAIHGGAMGGFMETAGILHLLMKLKTQSVPKVIDFSIDYLRPGRHQDTHAECQVVRQGRKVVNISVIAWQDAIDKPIATARIHYLLSSQ